MAMLAKSAARRIFVALSLLAATSFCFGADLVFVRSSRGVSLEQEEIQAAADFYGLRLRVITTSAGPDYPSILTAVEESETVGVVIHADALPAVNENTMLRALKRKGRNAIPLLILGADSDLSPALLRSWSGGGVTGCKGFKSSSNSQYAFGRVEGVTWQLANVDFPHPVQTTSYSAFDVDGAVQQIESVREVSKAFPVFVKSAIGSQIVFMAGRTTPDRDISNAQDVMGAFLRIAPAMIFVRYCAGERGWHALHYYANFTIDDPWLREPYGYLDYEGLLKEMEKHHFHTTIAFIPWNYDRSQPKVVSLFRDHPDCFSIAVHGDNHDHKEFTNYQVKSLNDQAFEIRQALARMDRFQVLTGIGYDKVMIFPHSIAPEQTLEALKKYNFLATVNSSNIPQDSITHADLSNVLRPVTLSYDAFPSISRYPTEVPVPKAYVAVSQFLGNPLFFYDHSDFFSNGIGAFDHVADEVNNLEPATEWRSLGEIVRHLYLVKLRDDSDFDVLAFSNTICVENRTIRSAVFYIEKSESGSDAIRSVTVDGRIHAYTLQEGKIRLAVPIGPGGTSSVVVQYANDLESVPANPGSESVVVYLLRMGSDFRDIYLAKSGVGLAVIRFYTEHDLTPSEVVGCSCLFLVVSIYGGFWLRGALLRRSVRSQQDLP